MEKIVNIGRESNGNNNGYLAITKHVLSFVDSMVLKCAVDLKLADILHSNSQPMTLSQIATHIKSRDNTPINQDYLERIMRMLVRLEIFTITSSPKIPDNGTKNVVLYGTTPSSKALLSDSDASLAPLSMFLHHPMEFSAFQHLSDSVREGVSGFKKVHGADFFESASKNPELNKIFNLSMKALVKIYSENIFSVYRDGFSAERGVETVVDVGGGMGHLIRDVVNQFPHIKGINFDLPHVVAMGLESQRVSHVAGDVFKDDIPHADLILLKLVLHVFGNEECIKILKNCKKSIKNNNGKVIIIEVVIREEGESNEENNGNLDVYMDIIQVAMNRTGKERTKKEWKYILEEAGFKHFNFIPLPFLVTLIEVY